MEQADEPLEQAGGEPTLRRSICLAQDPDHLGLGESALSHGSSFP